MPSHRLNHDILSHRSPVLSCQRRNPIGYLPFVFFLIFAMPNLGNCNCNQRRSCRRPIKLALSTGDRDLAQSGSVSQCTSKIATTYLDSVSTFRRQPAGPLCLECALTPMRPALAVPCPQASRCCYLWTDAAPRGGTVENEASLQARVFPNAQDRRRACKCKGWEGSSGRMDGIYLGESDSLVDWRTAGCLRKCMCVDVGIDGGTAVPVCARTHAETALTRPSRRVNVVNADRRPSRPRRGTLGRSMSPSWKLMQIHDDYVGRRSSARSAVTWPTMGEAELQADFEQTIRPMFHNPPSLL